MPLTPPCVMECFSSARNPFLELALFRGICIRVWVRRLSARKLKQDSCSLVLTGNRQFGIPFCADEEGPLDERVKMRANTSPRRGHNFGGQLMSACRCLLGSVGPPQYTLSAGASAIAAPGGSSVDCYDAFRSDALTAAGTSMATKRFAENR